VVSTMAQPSRHALVVGIGAVAVAALAAILLKRRYASVDDLLEVHPGNPSKISSSQSTVSTCATPNLSPVKERRGASFDTLELTPVVGFLEHQDILHVVVTSTKVRDLLTFLHKGRRLMICPVVRMKMETADLARHVSWRHVVNLRFQSRLAFTAICDADRDCGPGAFEAIEKVTVIASTIHKYDIAFWTKILQRPRIAMLNVERNQLRDDVVKELCLKALPGSNVDTLCLRMNQLTDASALALAELQHVPNNLKTLNLKQNKVTDVGAVALAGLIPRCPTLQLLNLRNQTPGIGDRAAEALAEAIQQTTSLKRLLLRRNKIGEQGALALAHAVSNNISLTELDLESNYVTASAAASLIASIQGHPTLNVLALGEMRPEPLSVAWLRGAAGDLVSDARVVLVAQA